MKMRQYTGKFFMKMVFLLSELELAIFCSLSFHTGEMRGPGDDV